MNLPGVIERIDLPLKKYESVGYKTDVRTAFDGEDNLMLLGALSPILRSEDELRGFFSSL